MKIYDAIDAATKALASGAHPNIVRMALISDGFPVQKAETILGWATQNPRKGKQMKTIDEMKELFPWEDGMGEISGFGGGYEQACRNMVYAGLAWLETKPDADLKAKTYKNIYGIISPESPDAEALEQAILAAEPECSGAMMQASMGHVMFIAKNGWNKYASEMRRGK